MGRPDGFKALGIDENDFINNEEKDFGKTVTIKVRTGTLDFRGNEHEAYSSGTDYTVVIHKREQKRVRGPDGMWNESPAYMMSRISIGVGTGDRVVNDEGQTFRVLNATNRDGIFIYSDLVLVEGVDNEG